MRFDKRNLGEYSIPLTPPTKRRNPSKVNSKKKVIINENVKPGFIKCPICNEIQPNTNSVCRVCKVNLNKTERAINFITNEESLDFNFFLLLDDENSLNQFIGAFKDNNIYNQVKILDNTDVNNISNNFIIENFHEEIINLININKLLNFYYEIPFYNNVYSSKYLKNLHVLKNNPQYIDSDDLNEFADFIKILFENKLFVRSKNFEDIPAVENYVGKLVDIKSEISEFNKNINDLFIFYNKWGIKYYDNLNKSIDLINSVAILKDKPSLINNKMDVNNFIILLEKYNELNKKNKDSSFYIKNFKVKNKILLNSFNYFNRLFKNNPTKKNEIKILNFSNYLEDLGFNLINIFDQDNFKNFVLDYKNAELIQDDNFHVLDEKLTKYLENSNISFSNHFNKFYKKLNKLVRDKISEKSEKLYEKSEINTIKNLINDLFYQIDLLNEDNNFNELEKNLDDLNNNFYKLKEILDKNNLDDFKSLDFNKILKETPQSFKFSEYNKFYKKYINKIKNCNIFNFNSIIHEIKKDLSFKKNDKKLNEILFNFNIIKEILDLSSRLNIIEDEILFNYDYDELLKFHNNIRKNIEFTNYFNKNLFNDNIFDFYNSKSFSNDLNDISFKLQLLYDYIDNNNLILENVLNKSVNQLETYSKFENIFLQTKELFTKDDSKISISDYMIIIDNLLYLSKNTKLTGDEESLLFFDPLLKAKDKLNKYSIMYEYENEINTFDDIIDINLGGIWNGYHTKLNKVKNKLNSDLKFTELYAEGIFTDTTLASCKSFSKSDLKILEKINKKLHSNYEIICDNKLYDFDKIYRNDLLNQYLSYLDNFDNSTKYYNLLVKINDILNRNDFAELIKSIGTKKYENLINKYDLANEDNLLSVIDNNIKYTQLIDYGVLNKENINLVKKEIDNVLYYINQLEEYRLLVIERINEVEIFNLSTDFNEILNQVSKKRIFILNKKLLNKSISKDFIDYFDKILIPRNNDEMYIEELLNATNKVVKML